jgi:phosphate transport system substrate-binding protein
MSTKVKAVDVDNATCTRENVLDGKYTLSRPLFMYTNGTPSGSVKKFLDFVLSSEGQRLVEEEGFVGLK